VWGQIGGFITLRMGSWNWDENENESEYNDAVWPCSNGTVDPSNFPSFQVLPTNHAVPTWSQEYETTLRAIQRPLLPIDESGGHSDTTCQDTVAWEYWNAWRDVGSKGCDGLNGTSEAPYIRADSMGGISPLDSSISTSTSYISQPDSCESTSAVPGRAYLNGKKATSPTLRGAPPDQWIRGMADGRESLSSVTSSYAESSNIPGLVNSREMSA